jgi:AraC family transcriptional regulator
MSDKLKIQRSIDYIEKHLCENIKLNEIAKQSYFSKYHFHRLFRKTTGASVMEYIRRSRLTKAARDLSETNEKIINVAVKYQFGSTETFSRAFKKMYGIGPREYRNTYKIIKITNNISSGSTTLCMAA